MKFCIARDTNNDLHLFKNKPNPEVCKRCGKIKSNF